MAILHKNKYFAQKRKTTQLTSKVSELNCVIIELWWVKKKAAKELKQNLKKFLLSFCPPKSLT